MLNLDFAKRAVQETAQMPWGRSPMPGVWRKRLAREGVERGHATSIVRYDPGSSFSAHEHPGGEEILVLDGIFSDDSGDYEAGSYLRNPPGSKHTPFSESGCVLFVKLHQFAPSDQSVVAIRTQETPWRQGQGRLKVMPLHEFSDGEQVESVALVKWPASETFTRHTHFGGEEIFVISGEFCDEHGRYPKGTWIRSPHMSVHTPFTEVETVIWVKVGHLATGV